MGVVPRVSRFQVGEPGSAAQVEGLPAMLLAQQPDAMIDAGEVGALTVRAASVRGAGHRYDGTPRQDDFCLGTAGARNELLVAVVADGVSAGPRSHLAARVVVRLGVQLVAQAIANGPVSTIDWDALVGSIAGHVLLQARKDRGNDQLDAREAAKVMASTAAFAIVPVERDPNGVRTCTVVPIGDTSVWVLRGGQQWESVTPIKNEGAAVASSAVFALPLLPSTPIVALTAVLLPGDALFVVTDGVGDPLGEGSGDVGRALAATWATPPNRYEFAAQVDFARRSHTDDRTAVGIWVEPPRDTEPVVQHSPAGAPPPEWVDLAPVSAPVSAPAPPSASGPSLPPPPGAPPPPFAPPAPVAPPPPAPDASSSDTSAPDPSAAPRPSAPTPSARGGRTAPAPTAWVPSAAIPPSTRASTGAADATSSSPFRSTSPYGSSSPYASTSPYGNRQAAPTPDREADPSGIFDAEGDDDTSDDDPAGADPAR